jgi:hypothetical protein
MINKAEINGEGNIVIQDADNSEITINMNNPEEIRNFFIDFQTRLSEIPKQIIDLMQSKNSNEVEIIKGANVYLSVNLLFGLGGGGIAGLSFGITITNLTKENRFFNAPFFKLSTPFEGNADTFAMTDTMNNIAFPKKLEYGEVVTENYQIRPHSREIYEKVLARDENATLQVITTTTVGEIYKSNEYEVSKLLENFKYAR